MSPRARVLFAVAALAALSVIAWFSFRGEAAVVAPITAAPPAEPLAAMPASAPSDLAVPPEVPDYIPYNDLTKAAAAQNRVIYTTSAMGEPMEVHPDGMVVIHNHKKVFTFADGRTEVRYARITARPTYLPKERFVVPPEDAPPKK